MAPDDPPGSGRSGVAAEGDHPGRFQVAHRGGTRIEVGEPVNVGGSARPWMCAVKLVGRKREEAVEGDATQTLLVRMGRGASAEDARRDAIAQLTLVYGSPVEPPPSTLIVTKASDPPPGRPAGWLGRLLARLRR